MDLVFNEISSSPIQRNLYDAMLIMDNFLSVLKKAKEYGFHNIRVQNNFYQSLLCTNYSIADWLSDGNVKQTSKMYLMSICKTPFIKEDELALEKDFVMRTFYFQNSIYSKTIVEGLAVAYLAETLSISFPSHLTWRGNIIKIEENNGSLHDVNNISDLTTFNKIDQWIEERVGPILTKTNLPPSAKSISLRNDHGKDKLKAFSNKLVNCEFVVGIINSLPFNPTETNFIRKVRANGLIEIVLTDTDEGFGLIVQTTGESLTQTAKIAEIISDRYS